MLQLKIFCPDMFYLREVPMKGAQAEIWIQTRQYSVLLLVFTLDIMQDKA